MSFQVGVRTVPAGSLQFVDFSKPDAARRPRPAVHDRRPARARRGRRRRWPPSGSIYARDADPTNPAVLRLLTAAFWQAGNLPAAARTVRDWARVETDRPTPERFASRIYEDMGAIDLAADAADAGGRRAPGDASAWERLGRLRLRLMDRAGAIVGARARPADRPDGRGLLDLALAYHLAGDVGAEVSAAEAATRLDPESQARGRPTRTRWRAPTASGVRRGVRASARARRGPRGRRSARAGRPPSPIARERAARHAPRVPAHRGRLRPVAGHPACRAPRHAVARPWQLPRIATRSSPRARTGQLAGGERPPAGAVSTDSSTPSSSPTRQTSRRSSSTSIQAPAEAGNTTWSPGWTGIGDPDVIPPVEPGADREHDPVLGRRLVGARRHDQPGAAHPIGVELLDHDPVEQGAKLLAHGVKRPRPDHRVTAGCA